MTAILRPDMSNIWAQDGDVAQLTADFINTGWVVSIPECEQMNAVQHRQDQGIAYILQRGIAEWDSNTEYQLNSIVQYGGLFYRAISININQPCTGNSNWVQWSVDTKVFTDFQDWVNNVINSPNPFDQYLLKSDPQTSAAVAAGAFTRYGSGNGTGLFFEGSTLVYRYLGNVRAVIYSGYPDQNDYDINNLANTKWVTDKISQVVNSESNRAYSAEQALGKRIDDEYTRASNEELNLQQQIDILRNTVKYPLLLASGVMDYSNQAVTNFESVTAGWSVQSDGSIGASGIDMTDKKYVITIQPENSGEIDGFSISRTTLGFKPNVWQRSGTTRVGFTGLVGFTVVQVNA